MAFALAACGGNDPYAAAPPATAINHSVGGAVAGLSGTIVLQNEGGDDLSIAGSSTFTFGTLLPSGASYLATIRTQPAGQDCTITNGAGIVGKDDVIDLVVSCGARPAAALAHFAGDPAGSIGTAAGFNQPAGIATDLAGNVYVADTLNPSVRRITPAGVVQVTNLP